MLENFPQPSELSIPSQETPFTTRKRAPQGVDAHGDPRNAPNTKQYNSGWRNHLVLENFPQPSEL
ncbi:MAG: hypothetical protein ACTIA6_02265, partial [Pseudoclavibacter sp.]